MTHLFEANHWTVPNLVLVLLGIFIVESFRILGRSSNPTTQRTLFSLRVWFGQLNNWFSPVVSLACALALLAFKDDVMRPGVSDALFAFLAGASGQALIKLVIHAARGISGAYGRANASQQ